MSDKAILVTDMGGAYAVIVREGGSETRHEVTGAGDARRVEAAFAFLLDREPKESILARFDLSAVSRYFPEFERELPRYLDKLR